MESNLEQDDSAEDLEILVVEDSPTQALQLQLALEDNGYRVATADNGRAALAYLAEHDPALVLTDIIMPEMDGYELCQSIRTNERIAQLPVILLTALSEPGDIIKGLECRADCFITKPWREEFLLARMDYVLVNRDVRGRAKTKQGMNVLFERREYLLPSDPIRMVDLLICTFDNAVQKSRELAETKMQLQDALAAVKEQARSLAMIRQTGDESGSRETVRRLGAELDSLRAGYEWLEERYQETQTENDGLTKELAALRDSLARVRPERDAAEPAALARRPYAHLQNGRG